MGNILKINMCKKQDSKDGTSIKYSSVMHRFSVAVVATMSSGKSTLLNAMLGYPLLPSKNEACTSTIFKLVDVDGMKSFLCRAKQLGSDWDEWQQVDVGTLENFNSGEYSEVEVHGDFPHIDNYLARLSISFFDTPGPNNSCSMGHAEITHNILNSSDYSFMLCVLNATQVGVNDERELLHAILKKMPVNSERKKIVFVLNKIDMHDIQDGEFPIVAILKVKKYLKSLGFSQSIIIPAMSQFSLDARLILNSTIEGNKIPLSKRKQKQFIRQLEYIHKFANEYSQAILHSPGYEIILKEALIQKRPYSDFSDVVIANNKVSLDDIIVADILSGIPVLEEYLETELKIFSKKLLCN